ncbi:hypothetical protein PsAD5_00120 [Pseudovibrio sp. Ad5]|uniref:hypothetical protein n=1 Tax=Pseudovibrio sp. Ad5 TaxID=989436 RepID=UPI0007AE94CB|nr:hypothetical protein [Pseudovibrio sp. Ad5]KZL02171.1 hypothetical protein PsAD5_00120 [Pseudovibrio sp. Ad5]
MDFQIELEHTVELRIAGHHIADFDCKVLAGDRLPASLGFEVLQITIEDYDGDALVMESNRLVSYDQLTAEQKDYLTLYEKLRKAIETDLEFGRQFTGAKEEAEANEYQRAA